MWENKLKQVELLINRLERLSSDSIWAHRASGIRGSLLEFKEELSSRNQVFSVDLDRILAQGFFILGEAAKISLTINKVKVKYPDKAKIKRKQK